VSTELSQLGLDGEQQLGINPGSSEGGRQMGINPCPLSSHIIPNGEQQPGINPGSPDGGQQMGINPCPYTMGDNKWESTHVHQTHFIGSMQPLNSGQNMGRDLQNSLVLGPQNHKRVWPQCGGQQMGINPCLLGSPN
jgi:hypothetical protein